MTSLTRTNLEQNRHTYSEGTKYIPTRGRGRNAIGANRPESSGGRHWSPPCVPSRLHARLVGHWTPPQHNTIHRSRHQSEQHTNTTDPVMYQQLSQHFRVSLRRQTPRFARVQSENGINKYVDEMCVLRTLEMYLSVIIGCVDATGTLSQRHL